MQARRAIRSHRPAFRPSRAWLHLALPLVLLLAQSFGLLHGVVHPHAWLPVHAGLGPHTHTDAAPSAPVVPVAPATAAHHDEGSSLCRLVDHLAQADLLPPTPVQVTVVARPDPVPVARPAGSAARIDSPYEARGPPARALA